MRIGHGYDVHRLAPGRKLVLGGITVPYELGLEGHSDADVLTHAVMDSLLGALALGDIGTHFPDTGAAYKDANSILLLCRVIDMIAEAGYRIGNIDATLVAQRPRLSPYIDGMRENLAKVCRCGVSQVNVKATTEEGLGFTGSGQGIAAHSIALIEPVLYSDTIA